jgi:hypothetical protein
VNSLKGGILSHSFSTVLDVKFKKCVVVVLSGVCIHHTGTYNNRGHFPLSCYVSSDPSREISKQNHSQSELYECMGIFEDFGWVPIVEAFIHDVEWKKLAIFHVREEKYILERIL